MKKSVLSLFFGLLFIFPVRGQDLNNMPVPGIAKSSFRKEIKLPDIPGYKTLVTAHQYHLGDSHRPMTLVFAKERTKEALKEAMFARRTVAWVDGKMAGSEKLLKAFFKASLDIKQTGDDIKIKNLADMPFILSAGSNFNFTIPALGEIYLSVPDEVQAFNVNNLYTGASQTLQVKIDDLTF